MGPNGADAIRAFQRQANLAELASYRRRRQSMSASAVLRSWNGGATAGAAFSKRQSPRVTMVQTSVIVADLGFIADRMDAGAEPSDWEAFWRDHPEGGLFGPGVASCDTEQVFMDAYRICTQDNPIPEGSGVILIGIWVSADGRVANVLAGLISHGIMDMVAQLAKDLWDTLPPGVQDDLLDLAEWGARAVVSTYKYLRDIVPFVVRSMVYWGQRLLGNPAEASSLGDCTQDAVKTNEACYDEDGGEMGNWWSRIERQPCNIVREVCMGPGEVILPE